MSAYDSKRIWNVLCWNVRGINSDKKWISVRDKIIECKSVIVCLQETKKEHLDLLFIHKFYPRNFDRFEYLPSQGASGGIAVIWKSTFFSGQRVFMNKYAISIKFSSTLSDNEWILTTVYGPCTLDGKREFTQWLKNIQMLDGVDWLLIGDFNLIREPTNRNKLGGNYSEMFIFNEAISALGLLEIPLKSKRFTWTNKQRIPLLERLDWFFSSTSWSLSYPNTTAFPLVMETSDHSPCVISLATDIPNGRVFRFENYWLQHEDFLRIVEHGWTVPITATDKAKIITAKFKNLRRVLRFWQATLSGLKTMIQNVKLVLSFLELIEESRDLLLIEWNFKALLQEKLQTLLLQQKNYWKQGGPLNG